MDVRHKGCTQAREQRHEANHTAFDGLGEVHMGVPQPPLRSDSVHDWDSCSTKGSMDSSNVLAPDKQERLGRIYAARLTSGASGCPNSARFFGAGSLLQPGA